MNTLVIITICAFVNISNAYAWGQIGHRVVGEIAESHLTEKAKKSIKAIMKNESLARASTKADEFRSDPNQKYYSKFLPLHYTTFYKDKVYTRKNASKKGDVVLGIDRMISILKNKKSSMDKKVEAIRFLTHFVGDIHQPLHVGNGFDRGGNDCKVKWFGEKTNLHKVWDTHLIEYTKLSYTEFVKFINFPRKSELSDWQKGNHLLWAKEASKIRKTLYPAIRGKLERAALHERKYCSLRKVRNKDIPKLSYNYVYRWRPVIEKQLLKAGVRLAGILNEIYN